MSVFGIPIAQFIVACLAATLVGLNVALLVEFGSRFSSWWSFKLVAVMALLAYVVVAMTYGNPTWWRVSIAAIACVLDAIAFGRVYHAVRSASRGGIKLVVYTPEHANGQEDRG